MYIWRVDAGKDAGAGNTCAVDVWARDIDAGSICTRSAWVGATGIKKVCIGVTCTRAT